MLLILGVTFVFIFCLRKIFNRLFTNCPNLPPSPLKLPLVGNLYLMQDAPHLVFEKLGHKYGKIFTFWMGGKPAVIINDEDLCKQAVFQQGHIFSGRPHRYCGGLYSRNFKGIVLSDDDIGWRYRKKLACSALRNFSELRNDMDSKIIEECNNLKARLRRYALKNEEINIGEDISLAMLNIICGLVFGSRYHIEDKEFREIADVNSKFLYGIQAAPLVDAFPFLRYLPLRKLKWINEFVVVRDRVLGRKYSEHDQTYTDTHLRDFIDYLIKESRDSRHPNITKDNALSMDHRIIMMGDLFLAGVETIATALLWGILYLIKWPIQQKLIQNELDQIHHKISDLSYSNRSKMPVMEAAITEVLRLSAVAPLGVPHKTTDNTTFSGYQIPIGTVIYLNIYAINCNPEIWDAPDEFRIERFLDKSGNYVHPSRGFFSFGAGKRICPGENLARMELFYFLSGLLSEFEFQAVTNKVSLKGNYATSWAPLPFKVRVSLRS